VSACFGKVGKESQNIVGFLIPSSFERDSIRNPTYRSGFMGRQPRSKSSRTHKHSDFTRAVTIKNEDDLFAVLGNLKEPPFLLLLDCVQDPHNLGACLRSADAAGVHAVVAPKDRSVSLTDTVRKVACGAAEHVPFVMVTNLARTLKQLKEHGLWLVGTADDAKQSLYDIDLSGPLALVMGAEGKGLRRLTRECCDFLVHIPMAGSVECLNVSVATGVCLFEAVRQRRQQTQE
jgi:23S rRNA (guanosine2251-2'-O)-methyltransferase